MAKKQKAQDAAAERNQLAIEWHSRLGEWTRACDATTIAWLEAQKAGANSTKWSLLEGRELIDARDMALDRFHAVTEALARAMGPQGKTAWLLATEIWQGGKEVEKRERVWECARELHAELKARSFATEEDLPVAEEPEETRVSLPNAVSDVSEALPVDPATGDQAVRNVAGGDPDAEWVSASGLIDQELPFIRSAREVARFCKQHEVPTRRGKTKHGQDHPRRLQVHAPSFRELLRRVRAQERNLANAADRALTDRAQRLGGSS